MNRKEIKARLKELIEPYVQNDEAFKEVNEETDLLQDLEINSAHLVDIILDMEEEFDIEIDDDTAEKMTSVGSAIEITERLLNEQK